KKSKRLARTIFHKMNRYMAALEYKQRVLARCVDIGTDLFSISAAAAYAGYLLKENPSDKKSILSVMETYFTFAEQRIEQNFKDLSKNFDNEQRKLGIDVIENSVTWLEKGAISEKSTRQPNF